MSCAQTAREVRTTSPDPVVAPTQLRFMQRFHGIANRRTAPCMVRRFGKATTPALTTSRRKEMAMPLLIPFRARFLRLSLPCAVAGACLSVMTGWPDPRILSFTAAPTEVCPGGLVALEWNVESESISLRADRATSDAPLPDHTPIAGRGGFRFRVGSDDTTFTLVAHRNTRPDSAPASVTVRVRREP